MGPTGFATHPCGAPGNNKPVYASDLCSELDIGERSLRQFFLAVAASDGATPNALAGFMQRVACRHRYNG